MAPGSPTLRTRPQRAPITGRGARISGVSAARVAPDASPPLHVDDVLGIYDQDMAKDRLPALAIVTLVLVAACTSPTPDAATSVEPIGSVQVPFADRMMNVTIVGEADVLTGWRAANDRDLGAAVLGDSDIALSHLPNGEIVLSWIGTPCDVEATLVIEHDRLVVAPAPRPGCDTLAVGRGVVLSFSTPVEPAAIVVDLLDPVLLPEAP